MKKKKNGKKEKWKKETWKTKMEVLEKWKF